MSRGRDRGRATPTRAPATAAVAGGNGNGGLVALPGERLSRAAGSLTEADLAKAEVFTLDDLDEETPVAAVAEAPEGVDTRRNRPRPARVPSPVAGVDVAGGAVAAAGAALKTS